MAGTNCRFLKKLRLTLSIWKKNQKVVLAFLAIIVIGVGGWYAYKEYVSKPKELKAAEALYKVQQLFAIDSSNLVINGDNATGTANRSNCIWI